MPVAAPTLVRNTMPGPTVMSDLNTKEYVEWAGAGDPSGGDVQPVPETFFANVNFMRALQRSILVVENLEQHPEIADVLDRQNKAWAQRNDDAAQAVKMTLDHQANNDYITLNCIGPIPRGSGLCGVDIMVRAKSQTDKPPLCSLHDDMASQYVPEEAIVDGVNTKRWIRAQVTRAEFETQ